MPVAVRAGPIPRGRAVPCPSPPGQNTPCRGVAVRTRSRGMGQASGAGLGVASCSRELWKQLRAVRAVVCAAFFSVSATPGRICVSRRARSARTASASSLSGQTDRRSAPGRSRCSRRSVGNAIGVTDLRLVPLGGDVVRPPARGDLDVHAVVLFAADPVVRGTSGNGIGMTTVCTEPSSASSSACSSSAVASGVSRMLRIWVSPSWWVTRAVSS